MNKRMAELMRRRQELLARIDMQRGQVAEIGRRWETPLAIADQGVAAARFLRSHPVLVAGVAALLLVRRRGVVGLAKGAWMVWKGYRSIAALSAKLSTRL